IIVGTDAVQILSNKSFSDDLDMDGNKITNLMDPSDAQDASTKAYVDAVATGLKLHEEVNLATDALLTADGTFSNLAGGTDTLTFTIPPTIDGVVVGSSQRILVKNGNLADGDIINGIWFT